NTRFARGMRAGRWLFASGLAGTDYATGLAPEVERAWHPWNGPPPAKREAERLYRNLAEILAAGGAGMTDVVRLDQDYASGDAVHPYHEARTAAFKGRIPPSTSVLQQRFLRQGQQVEALAMAALPSPGFKAEHKSFEPGYAIHHTSGYSPGLAAGDF